MSSANAIIKVNNAFYDMAEITIYETGNGDFFGNGFHTITGMFMVLLTPANAESEITKEIAVLGGDIFDENWLKSNASRFISFFRVKEKNNQISTQEEQDELRNKIEREENQSSTTEAVMKYAPSVTYNLVVTDPKWISHLKVDMVFETMAYDVI